jgi:hypothetical protein
VTDIAGQPEQCVSLNSAWPFSEHAICEAQLTVILSTALTLLTFYNSLQMFVTDSFSATRNSIVLCCLICTILYPTILMISCACARKVLFHVAPLASGTFKINISKKLQLLPVDFDLSTECVAKLFGQPSYVFLQIKCLLSLSDFHQT